MQKFEGTLGDYMAIKMRIGDPQHVAAWARAREGVEKIASRLECCAVHIHAEQPDWSNLHWRPSTSSAQPAAPNAAAQVDTDQDKEYARGETDEDVHGERDEDELAINVEDSGARGIIKQGSLCIMQRASQQHRQAAPPSDSLVWKRAWFQLASTSPEANRFELRMLRSPLSPFSSSGSCVPLAVFSLENAEIRW